MEGFLTLIFIVLIGAAYFYLRSPSFKGAVGEKRVNVSLRTLLNAEVYTLLADLTLPTKNGTTQIDHVVLSQYGIFVIETKNMSGWIFGSADQSRWTQVFRKHKTRFQNPLRQNYHHVKVIEELLGVKTHNLHNVVAFVGSAELRTEMPPNVVSGIWQLADYIKSKREPSFSKSEVGAFTDLLTSRTLENNRQLRRQHVRHVKIRALERKNDKSKCPRCSAKMVERTNKRTGEKFLGCSRYPKCRGTR